MREILISRVICLSRSQVLLQRDSRYNIHGLQFLEKQLARIWDL